MSTLTQFVGGNLPPSSIVNLYSTNGYAATQIFTTSPVFYVKEILSGALTATVLKTLLSITGGGAIQLLSVYTKDATSRTIRCKITIDGTVVYDATSGTIAASGSGGNVVGAMISNVPYYSYQRFASSLLIEVASSLSETDKVAIGIVYNLNA